ncbi:MAG: GNAT family N-acetyltransferase [Pseudomonadota bacterium]|nr:GNAT family N-acetyltransferase [Pseudomonadota bacterium]|tara:strand:- start:30 stop:533 length:504 start_codon:yes stop_codon:yes gene_type:complete
MSVITLRDFVESDAKQLVAILNDMDVTQYLSTKIPSPYSYEDAQWWINEGSQSQLIKAVIFNDKLIGCVSVHPGEFEFDRSGELGYWLAKEYWRQGITVKAASMLLETVFSKTKIARVFAYVCEDNPASMKVLQRLGFEQDAILKNAMFKKGHLFNAHLFSLLKPKN